MVKNYMEYVVDLFIPTVLDDFPNICKCDKCVEDIKARALNNLPPYYVVTEKGKLFTKTKLLCDQFKADVIKEIVKAVNIVSSNPRHNLTNGINNLR